ncbi:hypothetical protein D8B26_002131 [Coccidioides posadasii str. Silveira]|uniref:Uncharacterized protein n=2 Tax=Coccidioides posadasii TaxID=199306 RepID=E9CV38_COCPS|nr:conserved hypothetical protein [Coccidioides posadasii str. Silveira]KMM65505.1 hypothetical protein CPAG_01855 [Coccidioides posadasii RMSCC 3488]QVM07433.1 hypothetical protein D8B26_002131 [Coccidioides posadasii str. Silveira]
MRVNETGLVAGLFPFLDPVGLLWASMAFPGFPPQVSVRLNYQIYRVVTSMRWPGVLELVAIIPLCSWHPMTATFYVADTRGNGKNASEFMSHARDTSYKFLLGSVLHNFDVESYADYFRLLELVEVDLRE